jgi:hypothetical protein
VESNKPGMMVMAIGFHILPPADKAQAQGDALQVTASIEGSVLIRKILSLGS